MERPLLWPPRSDRWVCRPRRSVKTLPRPLRTGRASKSPANSPSRYRFWLPKIAFHFQQILLWLPPPTYRFPKITFIDESKMKFITTKALKRCQTLPCSEQTGQDRRGPIGRFPDRQGAQGATSRPQESQKWYAALLPNGTATKRGGGSGDPHGSHPPISQAFLSLAN